MKLSEAVLIGFGVGLILLVISLIKMPIEPRKEKIQFPIVNHHKIGDTARSLAHWSLIGHELDGTYVYFHYKQHNSDSLRRIVAGHDENNTWTILDDVKYIKP